MTFSDDNGNIIEFTGYFSMTKKAVSFFNGAIKGDVSVTFRVDNNSVNREILGYKGPQMLNQIAWTKQPFNRMRNGNILDRGYLVIQGDNEDSLSCFYVSGNANWLQLLNGLITELDYSGVLGGNYITQLTAVNVAAMRTATSGIIFPMVDWCYNLRKGNNEWFCSNINDNRNDPLITYCEWYPSLYLHTLVDEISKQKGIKFSGNLLDDSLYKTIIIPPVKGEIKRDSINLTTAYGETKSTTSGSYILYDQFNVSSDPENLFSNDAYTANKYSKIFITINVISSSIPILSTGSWKIQKNNFTDLLTVSALGPAGYQDTYYLSTTAAPGDVFDIKMRVTGGGTFSLKLNIKIQIPSTITADDYFTPDLFLPQLPCFDIVKWIINQFGCVVTFNDFSKTINLNIVEKFKTEEAYDWSEYFISSEADYTIDSAQNNYLRLGESEDTLINAYNKSHVVKYGEGNITTGNTLKNERDIFKSPFSASLFGQEKNNDWLTSINLVNMNDLEPFVYSGTANDGSGNTQFTTPASTIQAAGTVVRIVDDNAGDIGYFVVKSGGLSSDTTVFNYPFTISSTGKIYPQEISFNDVKPRFLVCKPETLFVNFSLASSYNLYNTDLSLVPVSYTDAPYALFSKSATGYTIDQYKDNLVFDNPDLGGFTDPTIKELYFNKISRFLNNPNIKARFRLPESVYQRFAFDQFIYLKTERLTGYFFVDSIVNYVDGNTPVEVNLYML